MCVHFPVVGGLIQYDLHAGMQRIFHPPTHMPTEFILKGDTDSRSESAEIRSNEGA